MNRSRRALLGLVVTLGGVGCNSRPSSPEARPDAKAGAPRDGALEDPQATKVEARREEAERKHLVTFADRTSHSYILLLKGGMRPQDLSRVDLVGMVRKAFAGHLDDEEVGLLLDYVQKKPRSTAIGPDADLTDTDGLPDNAEAMAAELDRRNDLIGMHVELIELDAEPELIPTMALEDPILLRGLDDEQRLSLRSRRHALLLRADYRNRNAFRGLRLLQTLVRVVSAETGALIFDPDTLETVGLEEFDRRKLRGNLANVADQIAVLPFPDPAREGGLRLATRGMRRFGAVDLELTGLDADPPQLERATHLLYGLCRALLELAEVTEEGYAARVDDTITITRRDARAAYGESEVSVPECKDCPQTAVLHLVRRDPEPQDPHGHVVARVVAPRSVSDAPTYDHPKWVERMLVDMFGQLASQEEPPPKIGPG